MKRRRRRRTLRMRRRNTYQGPFSVPVAVRSSWLALFRVPLTKSHDHRHVTNWSPLHKAIRYILTCLYLIPEPKLLTFVAWAGTEMSPYYHEGAWGELEKYKTGLSEDRLSFILSSGYKSSSRLHLLWNSHTRGKVRPSGISVRGNCSVIRNTDSVGEDAVLAKTTL